MNQPLVSISCITFNHAPYIKVCLDGFLMQKTNFDFEILIHDDASTDGTKEIIEEYVNKYPSLIFPIYQTENQYSKGARGMMARFNFPRAKGKYIAPCEGDDYWTDPYKLQKQVQFLEENKDYSYCYHSWRIYNQETKEFDKKILKGNRTLTLLFKNNNVIQRTINAGVVNGDVVLKFALSTIGKAGFVKDIEPAVHRHHSGGIWSLTSEEYKHINRLKTYEKLLEIFPEKDYQFALKTKLLKNVSEIRKFEKLHKVKIIKQSIFLYYLEKKLIFTLIKLKIVELVRKIKNKFSV